MEVAEALFFRDQLRDARAGALRDAEGFQGILFAFERLGLHLLGKVASLGKYKSRIESLALTSPLATDIPEHCQGWHSRFSQLYDEVVDARNDALHQGAFARTLTSHAIQLALVLEDALMSNASQVSQFMTRGPATAQGWQPVSFVRQQMLVNSFSYLPLWSSHSGQPRWYLVSEAAVAKYLRTAPSNEERKRRLAATLESAILDGGLVVKPAQEVSPNASIDEALGRLSAEPLLVVARDNVVDLVGILTAFDVL